MYKISIGLTEDKEDEMSSVITFTTLTKSKIDQIVEELYRFHEMYEGYKSKEVVNQ